MRVQNVFTVLALLALAALVFIVVRSLSAPKPQSPGARAQRSTGVVVKYPQIYVAHENLEVGSFLDAGDLEPRDWLEQAIVPSEVRVDQVKASELAGSVVRDRMVKGEPIFLLKLVKPGERGFLAAVLLPGMRAVTLALDNVTGHSGLMLPGDRVDVILTQSVGGTASAGQAHVGETIVRSARVLAIGKALGPPDNPANVDEHPDAVTLEVTPKQAEAVSVAKLLGNLTLALRSLPSTPSDTREDELATTGADLSKPSAPTWGGNVSKALSSGTSVQIMRGSGDQR
jgi:pilus assembly protein CpaB